MPYILLYLRLFFVDGHTVSQIEWKSQSIKFNCDSVEIKGIIGINTDCI